jgi:SAM-dependent methyltransferase
LSDVAAKLASSVDVVLMSNFLEHLRSKEEVLKTLADVSSILRAGGVLLILQPNIRYAYKEYWDFFDHHLPLSDKSLVEALRITGFEIERLVPRFLPYTTKSAKPRYAFLVRAYLHCPLAWKIMGKQMFVVARRPSREDHENSSKISS